MLTPEENIILSAVSAFPSQNHQWWRSGVFPCIFKVRVGDSA